MQKLIKAIAVSVLSLTAATAVYAQRPPESWVLVVTSQGGDRTYFDLSSQIQVFDAGFKENTFRIVTTSPQGKALRAVRYHANCLKGTLASHKLEVANAQGSLTQEVPLEREDKIATVPANGTVAAAILRYACSRF